MTLKFKYAEPVVVSDLMADALREFVSGPDQEISDMVRAIATALFNAGCVVIQLDQATA